MRRGLPLITCALLAVAAAVVVCTFSPGAAWAQNAAESKPKTEPAASSTSKESTEAESKAEAEKESTEEAAAEAAADKSGTNTAEAGKTGEETPVFVVTPPPPPDDNVAEGGAVKQQPGTNTAEQPGGGTPPEEPGSFVNGDGVRISRPIPDDNPPPVPVDDQTGKPGTPEGAPGTSPEQDTQPPPIAPPSNTAEGRPSGTGARNRAEGQPGEDAAESKVAVPPEPEYQLPSPADLAGSAEDYVAPEFTVSVPALQNAPGRENLDGFFQPERNYLSGRPLPGLDETEPDEERIARNIEESLKLLDLAMEQRSEEGMQIPLPSGMMTFKAANSFQYDKRNKILSFVGDVELLFNDIGIMADLVEVNDSAATAYARGYVMVAQGNHVIYCDEAYLNYDTESLELFWVEGNTGGKHLHEPLYFEADRAYGTFKHMILEGAVITTCDPFCGAHRDYEIKADKVHYKPDKSVVLLNAYLFLRDTKTAWFPSLGIPLPKNQQFTEDESDVQQTYGWSKSEGYYAKFGYTYWVQYVDELSSPLKGFAKLELMTKKGYGLGVRQDWYVPSIGPGAVLAYYRDDWPEEMAVNLFQRSEADAGRQYDFTIRQWLNLSKRLNGQLEVKRANAKNSTGTTNNSWNGKFNLGFNQGTTRVSLDGSYSTSISGGTTSSSGTTTPRTESSSKTATFSYNTNITKSTTFRFTQNYQATKGGQYSKTPANQEGNYSIELGWRGEEGSDLRGHTSTLTFKKSAIDYDQDRNDTKLDRDQSLDDRLPSFSWNFPKDWLGDKAYITDVSVSIDRLRKGKRSDPLEATSYNIHVRGGRTSKLSRASTLTYNAGFDQYWYSDSNSQWIISPSLNYTYDPADWWKFNAGWSMTYRQGVVNPPAPRHYSYAQSATYKFTFGNRRSWRWIVNSGFNFKTYKHSSIGSSFNWDANKLFGLTHTATYSIENETWMRSSLKATWKSPHRRDNGLINWMLAANTDFDTDYLTDFHMNKLGVRYFKAFENGWSGEATVSITSGEGQADANDLERIAIQDYLKKLVVRKTNCCTTWEATYLPESKEFSLILILNALPQYPGNLIVVDPFEDTMNQEFFFPSDHLRETILTDVVGLDSQQQSLLSNLR